MKDTSVARPVRPASRRALESFGHQVLMYWPALPIALLAGLAVTAGPGWAMGTVAAVVILCLLFVLRLDAAELLVVTVPLAFYVSVGGVLLNLAVSDFFLTAMAVRVIADPDCRHTLSRVSATVKQAVYASAGIMVLSTLTVMLRSILGESPEISSFVTDAVKLVVVIGYLVICLVFFREKCLRADYRFLRIWASTAAVVAMLGVVGSILFARGVQTSLTVDFRAVSTFEDPNAFATYLIMSVPVTMLARHVSEKSILSWQLVPIVGGVYVSFSRAALIGLLVLVLALLVFSIGDRKLRSLRTVAAAGAAIAAVLIANGFADKLMESRRGVSFEEDIRFRLWGAAWEIWRESPVFGVGLGQYIDSSRGLLGTEAGSLVHNTYLSILSETGIVGFLLFSLVPCVAAVGLFRSRDTGARLLLCSSLAAGVMAASLNLQNFRPIWIFLALAIAWVTSTGPDLDTRSRGRRHRP